MQIAIDLTALLPVATGVDNFLKNLVYHLAINDNLNQYRIYINREDRDQFSYLENHANFELVARSARSRVIRLLFQQFWLPWACFFWADVIHSPSFIMPFFRGRQHHVLTVQDMTSFTHPEHHIPLRRSRLYRFLVIQSIKRCDIVTVPSETTKESILEILPMVNAEKVTVFPYGVTKEFREYPAEEVSAVLARMNLPRDYILYVGTIEPRKNLSRLIMSYRKLVEEHDIKEHLVLAGKLGWDYQELLRLSGESHLMKERIHLTGYVDQNDLPLLYSGASLFVYPSLAEGFGLPPLEAMSCGTPVITSDKSSLAEYYHSVAHLVDPMNVEEIGAALYRLLSDEPSRHQMSRRGLEFAGRFRWQRMAREILDCYSSLS